MDTTLNTFVFLLLMIESVEDIFFVGVLPLKKVKSFCVR